VFFFKKLYLVGGEGVFGDGGFNGNSIGSRGLGLAEVRGRSSSKSAPLYHKVTIEGTFFFGVYAWVAVRPVSMSTFSTTLVYPARMWENSGESSVYILGSGRVRPRRRFSKVSALVHQLCKGTIASTFQNIKPRHLPAQVSARFRG